MFSKIIVAFSALAVLATALPTPGGESTTVSQCNTYGSAQCCNTVAQSGDSSITSIYALLGVAVDAADAMVGVNCVPIVGDQCSQKPVCCTGNKANGLINVQCLNIIL